MKIQQDDYNLKERDGGLNIIMQNRYVGTEDYFKVEVRDCGCVC